MYVHRNILKREEDISFIELFLLFIVIRGHHHVFNILNILNLYAKV